MCQTPARAVHTQACAHILVQAQWATILQHCTDPGLSRHAVQDVCRALEVDLTGQTSASYNMRLNYEKCLLEFEGYLASGQYDIDVSMGTAPNPYEARPAALPASRRAAWTGSEAALPRF